MAKKVIKKAQAKKTVKKVSKPKSTKDKKVVKKTAAKTTKSIVKKKVTKKPTAKKAVIKKVVAKKKATIKKAVTPVTKAKVSKSKTISKPRKKKVEEVPQISSAQVRAEALKKIKGYGKRDLEQFRQIILEKRDEIIEQLQNLRDQMLDPTTGEYINENSPYSLHMAEQGTDAMEREKTFLYAQRENKFLGYLEDALKRIDSGIYGICVECIDEPQNLCDTCPLVPKARLEAVPHSQLCLPMKQKQEKK